MRYGPFLVPFVLGFVAGLPAQAVEWWQGDFDGALAASEDSAAGMLLLYCWQDPSDSCSAMFGGTLSADDVAPVLGEFVCMGAKRNDDLGRQLLGRYGIESTPTVLFLTPDGAVVDVVAGYVPVADFVAETARIKKGEGTVSALRSAAAADAGDLELQLALVRKLRATGDKKGSLTVIDAIVAGDPKLRNAYAAEAMMLKLTDEVFPPDSSPQDWDIEPLYKFLRKQKNKGVLFLGYDKLASAEYRREDLKAWARFMERAWKSIPRDRVLDWGQGVATLTYRHHKELAKIDKGILKLALKISQKSLNEVEKAQKKTPDKAFLANAMYLHAAVLNVNNKRKDAFALMDEAIATDPKNENLKKAKDYWVKGNK